MNQFEQQLDLETIDRLVDKELSTSERCEILEQLEATPGGWRQCALAFLESQSWGQVASSMTATTDTSPSPETPRDHAPSLRWRARLAFAAGVLLAFGVGRISLPTSPSSMEPAASMIVNTPENLHQQHPVPQPLTAQFAFHAPVLFDSDHDAVPTDIQRYLNSIGQQAEVRRGYLPVQFRDGRQGVIPVKEVNINPVVNKLF